MHGWAGSNLEVRPAAVASGVHAATVAWRSSWPDAACSGWRVPVRSALNMGSPGPWSSIPGLDAPVTLHFLRSCLWSGRRVKHRLPRLPGQPPAWVGPSWFYVSCPPKEGGERLDPVGARCRGTVLASARDGGLRAPHAHSACGAAARGGYGAEHD